LWCYRSIIKKANGGHLSQFSGESHNHRASETETDTYIQAVIRKATSPRVNSISGSQKKGKFDLPERGARDIRNFFGAGTSKPKTSPKRKALKQVDINSPPRKKRALEYKEAVDKMPPIHSKFFSAKPATPKSSMHLEIETVLDDDSDIEELHEADVSRESIDQEEADLMLNVNEEEDEEAEEAWRSAHEVQETRALAAGGDIGNESVEMPEPPLFEAQAQLQTAEDTIQAQPEEVEDFPMDAGLLDYATSEMCPSEFGDEAALETDDEVAHFVVSSPPQSHPKIQVSPPPLKREDSKAESLEQEISSPPVAEAEANPLLESPKRSRSRRPSSDPFIHKDNEATVSSEISEFSSEPTTPALQAQESDVKIATGSESDDGQTPLMKKTRKTKKGLSQETSIVLSDDEDNKPLEGENVNAVVAGWQSKFMRPASSVSLLHTLASIANLNLSSLPPDLQFVKRSRIL